MVKGSLYKVQFYCSDNHNTEIMQIQCWVLSFWTFNPYKILSSWFKSLSWTKIHRILRLARLNQD